MSAADLLPGRLSLRKCYQRVLESDDGKRILADMARESGFSKQFAGEAGFDPIKLAWLEGRRSMFLYAWNKLDRAKDQVPNHETFRERQTA